MHTHALTEASCFSAALKSSKCLRMARWSSDKANKRGRWVRRLLACCRPWLHFEPSFWVYTAICCLFYMTVKTSFSKTLSSWIYSIDTVVFVCNELACFNIFLYILHLQHYIFFLCLYYWDKMTNVNDSDTRVYTLPQPSFLLIQDASFVGPLLLPVHPHHSLPF